MITAKQREGWKRGGAKRAARVKPCPNHPDRRGNCKGLCFNCRQLQLRRENPDKMRKHSEKSYRSHIKRTYGLSPDQYTELLAKQNGVCGICGNPPADGERLHVDHNHQTEDVRGLLCRDCNLYLGHAESNSRRIFGVLRYLGYNPALTALSVNPRCYSEINVEFLIGMCARMSTSFEKYGSIRDGFPDKINAIESLKLRLTRYEQTGNIEYLMDIGNFAMIEATLPRHPEAHFKAEDSHASPGRVHNTGLTSQAANTIQHESVRVGGFYKREGD